jgi:hypothetical protein
MKYHKSINLIIYYKYFTIFKIKKKYIALAPICLFLIMDRELNTALVR